MRKTALLVAVAVAICFLGVSKAQAAISDDISVTVTLAQTISVEVTPPTWDLGAVALSTTSAGEDFEALVGNIETKLEIKSTDGANGWVIAAAAGADAFKVAVTDPAFNLQTTNQQLSAGWTAYSACPFELKYSSPTSDTKTADVDQDFTITVTASAPI